MSPAPPFPVLVPRWQAPARVRAFATTRAGGVSEGAFASLNLGEGCGDDPRAVQRNRALLRQALPGDPVWLRQVHGSDVHDADATPAAGVPQADAAITAFVGRPLAVLTADCLPVVLADRAGSVVGIAHAGWRGAAAGVLENTVAAMRARAGAGVELLAWLGPAIGPTAFEVGDEVRAAFVARDPAAARTFTAARVPGKWWSDLGAFARLRLAALGVAEIDGGGECTVGDPRQFFSFRRDRVTGRMATLVWLEER